MPSPIIVALDFESAAEARALVRHLGPNADHYKIGLQLLTEAGPELVRELVQSGKSIFLDLKLHEIPNSVAGAVRAAGKLGASMVTVHASAGSAVLGCHGVVASAHEAAYLRCVLLEHALIVCPGIQLSSSGNTDQVRVATPAAAANAGATHVIIGRAITSAPEPSTAFHSALAAFHNGASQETQRK